MYAQRIIKGDSRILDLQSIIKGIILVEALTHAVRSWGILDPIRSFITSRSHFIERLLQCFECTSVWIAAATVIYITYFEFYFFTYLIIFQRLACYVNIIINLIDARRAGELNKL